MLEALTQSRFQITATWPVRSEGPNRLVTLGTNALASSVFLVCRLRLDDAPLATRRKFITALRGERSV